MREIVTIHLGQCGVQMGSAMWELLAYEHALDEMGNRNLENGPQVGEEIESLFCEVRGRYIPRAILVDLEPTVIDEIRVGPYKQMWNRNALLTGKEDAAGNYARAYVNIGKEMLCRLSEGLHKFEERSDSIFAFNMVHSFAGGTGSGLTALLAEYLADNYCKKFRFSTSVYPSAVYSQSTVDPYNATLLTNATVQTFDCCLLMDNKALSDRCLNQLEVEKPTYNTLNRFTATALSSVFLSHRFSYMGSQHADITELLTNLVPFPRIHFPLVCSSPLFSKATQHHETNCMRELTHRVFSQKAVTLDCKIEKKQFISCALLFRGVTMPAAINRAIQEIKSTANSRLLNSFVDWCPSSFKIGINTFPLMTIPSSPMATVPTSVCMVAGNVAVVEPMYWVKDGFDKLFKKCAFLHWFVGEGLEEAELVDAREELENIIADYCNLLEGSNDEEEEETPRAEKIKQGILKDKKGLAGHSGSNQYSSNSNRVRIPEKPLKINEKAPSTRNRCESQIRGAQRGDDSPSIQFNNKAYMGPGDQDNKLGNTNSTPVMTESLVKFSEDGDTPTLVSTTSSCFKRDTSQCSQALLGMTDQSRGRQRLTGNRLVPPGRRSTTGGDQEPRTTAKRMWRI
ncbi:unnamed protein product [Mesocestoides corti]|uniref:Tubulin domain-containing protein n=1 Tax=Mesocestoides corti TaxID=53468 RepID=A0A0R3UJ32_MESCO|nr:unnamed protein product [Mesocestoides corti]